LRYGKTIRIEAELSGVDEGKDAAELIYIQRRPEWVYALSAFIENACDFARSEVLIRVLVNKVFVSLSIEDDGPGFAPEIMAKLGEPYVSSRVFGDDAAKEEKKSYSGMGLGFFIAKTLLEHTKANVTFGNREDGGAYIRALWRRDQVDILWADDTKLTEAK
jgi:two-component system sensor histidine kinase RegB